MQNCKKSLKPQLLTRPNILSDVHHAFDGKFWLWSRMVLGNLKTNYTVSFCVLDFAKSGLLKTKKGSMLFLLEAAKGQVKAN